MYNKGGWWRIKEFEKIVLPKKRGWQWYSRRFIQKESNGDQPFKTQVDLKQSPKSAGD